MKSLEYTLPTRFSKLRIDKLKYFEMLKDDPKIMDVVECNAAFTGIPKEELIRIKAVDHYKLLNEINNLISKYKPLKSIPLKIKYNGQKYTFRDDSTKMPMSWFIDIDLADLGKNPEYLAAFVYVEEGMSYGEIDDHKNIINSMIERSKVFKEHMPLDLFMSLQAFFLTKFNVYSPLFIKIQKARELMIVEANGIGSM